MPNTNIRAVLLVTTALTGAGLATTTFAQTAPVTTNSNALEEVVVTATRQTSTVNKVALSVSAVTQKSLDQQGIRSVNDLSQQTPGLTFRVTGGDNNPQLTIRGIGGNAIGGTSGSAPTTGVYVDDIPLMKRNANGLETGSGSPTPLLYDLDRIEVLRGPQGTLYGGSSEGGTLRFITPNPSLTTYSGSARLGASTIAGGGIGDEEGIALGGPLIQDKLGFRISGFRQDRPGWINNYSEYDGHQTASQVNKGNDYSLHGTLLWQVTPNFKATVSVFNQMNYDQDSNTVRTNSPQVNVPLITINNGQLDAAGHLLIPVTGRKDVNQKAIAANAPLQVNGVQFAFPNTTFGGYSIPAQTWFGNRNGTANGLYLSPTNVQYVPSPRRTSFTTPSITLDYTWNDKLDFKSITANTSDTTSGWTFGGGGGNREVPGPSNSGFALGNVTAGPAAANQLSGGTNAYNSYIPGACPGGVGSSVAILTANCTISPQFVALPGTNYPANVFGYYDFNNRRNQTTQEFRVSTIDPSWRLQFVGGVFIEHEHNHVNVGSNWNENLVTTQIRGITEAYTAGGAYPAPTLETPTNAAVDVSTRNIDILEDEQSAFVDATFAVTSKFKITAGVRVTNYVQNFNQIYGGSVAGAPPGFVGSYDSGAVMTPSGLVQQNPASLSAFPLNYAACPSSPKDGQTNAAKYAAAGCPYQYTSLQLREHPVTPKIGASYQLTPGDLLYVTYAEGQRPGGINPPVPPVQCANDLATLGQSSSPLTYQHDTVKSTEVGGKFRLFGGQAQVNASAFHIDWDNVQFVVPLPTCAFSFIANAAHATSDGGEIQFTGRAMGFTLNSNIGYDKAVYAQNVFGAPGKLLANKGDNLGVPDWTANVGLQYDTRLVEMPAYARMDYAYTGKYMRGTGPGTTSFTGNSPNFINGNETHIVNGRVGVYYKDLEVALYVKNLFNSQEWTNLNQGTGSYYYSGQTVQPRIIGFQTNYRF